MENGPLSAFGLKAMFVPLDPSDGGAVGGGGTAAANFLDGYLK